MQQALAAQRVVSSADTGGSIDSEQFRFAPRTRGGVAGKLGALPRRTTAERRAIMMHNHSPSPWQLAVPGIGFPQSISIGRDMLEPSVFQDLRDDRFDEPRQPVRRLERTPSTRPWVGLRW